MKPIEIRAIAKQNAIEAILESIPGAVQYATGEIAIPFQIDGGTHYAKIAISGAQESDTKTTRAFNLDERLEKFAQEKEEKEKKAKEKAEAKAKKIEKDNAQREKERQEKEGEEEEAEE